MDGQDENQKARQRHEKMNIRNYETRACLPREAKRRRQAAGRHMPSRFLSLQSLTLSKGRMAGDG